MENISNCDICIYIYAISVDITIIDNIYDISSNLKTWLSRMNDCFKFSIKLPLGDHLPNQKNKHVPTGFFRGNWLVMFSNSHRRKSGPPISTVVSMCLASHNAQRGAWSMVDKVPTSYLAVLPTQRVDRVAVLPAGNWRIKHKNRLRFDLLTWRRHGLESKSVQVDT